MSVSDKLLKEENPRQRTMAKSAVSEFLLCAVHLNPEACGSSYQVKSLKGKGSRFFLTHPGRRQKPCTLKGFQTFNKMGLGGLSCLRSKYLSGSLPASFWLNSFTMFPSSVLTLYLKAWGYVLTATAHTFPPPLPLSEVSRSWGNERNVVT